MHRRVAQAVSNFGLIAAAAGAGVTCLLTARGPRRGTAGAEAIQRLLGDELAAVRASGGALSRPG